MSEHTPGPWHMQDRYCKRGISGIDIVDKDGSLICCLPDGASIKGGYAFPKQLVNARLIAAAPELLEACKAVINYAVDCQNPKREAEFYFQQADKITDKVKAAIAKATGENA